MVLLSWSTWEWDPAAVTVILCDGSALNSSTFTPQVKQAWNQSQFFNRKSISHNIMHCQSLHLQGSHAVLKKY